MSEKPTGRGGYRANAGRLSNAAKNLPDKKAVISVKVSEDLKAWYDALPLEMRREIADKMREAAEYQRIESFIV